MDWHAQNLEEVLKSLDVDSSKGLSEKEAKKRLKKEGKNELQEGKKKSRVKIFLSQLNSLLVYILIGAAIVSFLIGHSLDAIIIFVIVILNAVIGFIQEYKAEEIIDKLRKSLQYKILILRNEKQKEIDSKNLVPGDIVILNGGDKILADCRIIEQEDLQVNEAVLTGESFPVEKSERVLKKDVVLAERKNMLYAGSVVVGGSCKAVVVRTGEKTEFGKLAELVKETKSEKMPLEKKVDSFSTKVSIAVFILVGLTFVLGVYVGIDIVEMFLTSVSLAVAAIPSALPAVIAITLAIAIKRMYKVNTLVRKLPAAETLGRATVICTDKTGTLTREELNVDEIYAGKNYNIDEIKKLNKNLKKVLDVGILCNNARDESDDILGDPTEIALIKVAKKFGLNKKEITEDNQRIKEYAFDSNRKMMSLIRGDKIKTSYVKGASDVILERCTKEFVNGKIKLLTKKRKKELEKESKKMQSKGLRVLGFGFRQITKVSQEQAENHLIFAGFQGMIDLPREEVKGAIKQALDAGIEIKVVTGDSARTTKAIAGKLGLKGDIIEGKALNKIREGQWDKVVREKMIFARVTPEQKLKIVETLKKQKKTVAVTGDGVNDILALKKADIGVAMGVRGSDIARDSSDMVLLDDNFASITKAVKEGRRIFDNLKKSVKFLLAANAGEVFIIIAALLLGFPLPLLPLAILWMNLVTDSLPALALAVEPAEKGIMKQKPKKDGLLKGIWTWILGAGFLMLLSVMFVFNFALDAYGITVARTMAASVAIFFELFFSFSCKSKEPLFKTGILNNKYMIYSVLISIGFQLIAIYTLLGSLFDFVPLTFIQLLISFGASLSGLIFFEGLKIVRSKLN